MIVKVGRQVEQAMGEVQAVQVDGQTLQVIELAKQLPTEHVVQAEVYTPPLQEVQLGPQIVEQEVHVVVLGLQQLRRATLQTQLGVTNTKGEMQDEQVTALEQVAHPVGHMIQEDPLAARQVPASQLRHVTLLHVAQLPPQALLQLTQLSQVHTPKFREYPI